MKKKSTAQLDREIAQVLAGHTPSADAWDVAMDAIYEHNPKKAADVVRTIRKEHGIEGAPPAFIDAVRQLPEDIRRKFIALIDRIGKVPAQRAPDLKMLAWLQETKLRFPIGSRVRVTERTDIPEYVGARGKVIGYVMARKHPSGYTEEHPMITVQFDKPIKHSWTAGLARRDHFFADGEFDDEIVADRQTSRS